MEEILLTDAFRIKVKDNGRKMNIRNVQDRDLLIAHFFHTTECGCFSASDGPLRFKIYDTRNHCLWQVEGNMPDTCCGCEDSPLSARVVDEAGAVLGTYEGNEGYYKVMTQSRDILFIAEKGLLTSTYKITSRLDGNAEGKISNKFTFGHILSSLKLPPGLSQQHRVLLLIVALEATYKYHERQQQQ
ncbi:hypothetical protein Pcinc_011357 [Petrolisthes cinctipes]|uniref:Phospholipid scramblase n=1 Tax=Petrolisthes cinctipes TaxID=88211 RepID=A0AAE1KSL2_PETCI|nr:hypothetical protein Pcinc_011357 [Petrolisthes cinctipes]